MAKAILFLQQQLENGLTQAQIAEAVGISPQYLSDVLNGRRALTELLARRIGDHFHVDYRRVLGDDVPAYVSASATPLMLPVLPHPVEIEPTSHDRWDGSYIAVPSVAGSMLANAVRPYVLRFANDDVEGRLKKDDFLLMSQKVNDQAPIVVATSRKRAYLCRWRSGRWVRVAGGQALAGDATVVGHALGILWSPLI